MADPQRILSHTADSISAVAIVGTIMGYLPALAALAAIIWYAVQIWESKPVQRHIRLRRLHRRRIKLRKLEAIQREMDDIREAMDDAAVE